MSEVAFDRASVGTSDLVSVVRFNAVSPVHVSYFPVGALVSTSEQQRDEVRYIEDDAVKLAIDCMGRPAELSDESVLGRWSAGLSTAADRSSCGVYGRWLADNQLMEGMVACGRVSILAVNDGLRCAIAPTQGQARTADGRLRSIPSGHAYVFWLGYEDLIELEGSKRAFGLHGDCETLMSAEITPAEPNWISKGWKSRPPEFLESVAGILSSRLAHSTDPKRREVADRIGSINPEQYFGDRKPATLSVQLPSLGIKRDAGIEAIPASKTPDEPMPAAGVTTPAQQNGARTCLRIGCPNSGQATDAERCSNCGFLTQPLSSFRY